MKKGHNSEKSQIGMLKFQPPMLNDEVCRVPTDKQTHKTYIQSKNRVML